MLRLDYMSLTDKDPITPLRKAHEAGLLRARDDGRYEVPGRLNMNTPWVFIKQDMGMKCFIWHHVYFNYVGFIHSRCQECFKIVVRPSDIENAFKMYELMLDLDFPSKIGWESRETVFGNFGAYFYNHGLDEAKYRFKYIKKAVEECGIELQYSPYIKDQIQPLIKKGCTEFEMAQGSSKEWEVTPDQLKLERKLDEYVVQDMPNHNQAEGLKSSVMRSWIHNAFSIGDPTVAKVTGEKPLFAPYDTYHQEKDDG